MIEEDPNPNPNPNGGCRLQSPQRHLVNRSFFSRFSLVVISKRLFLLNSLHLPSILSSSPRPHLSLVFQGTRGFSRDVPRSLYRGRHRTSSESFRVWANSTPGDLYWFALPSFLFHMCHVVVNSWFLDSSYGSQRDACASDAL